MKRKNTTPRELIDAVVASGNTYTVGYDRFFVCTTCNNGVQSCLHIEDRLFQKAGVIITTYTHGPDCTNRDGLVQVEPNSLPTLV